MATCQFCNKTFSTVYKMKNHQKNAKYCLKLQRKNACICGEMFVTVEKLTQHQMFCKDFVKDMKAIDDKIEIIPAHCMTSWFGVFGSKKGFDSL